jgi:hypothetical protein
MLPSSGEGGKTHTQLGPLERANLNTPSSESFRIYRLRVFENRVLRIFVPERDEVTGGWRILHNEELHSLYSSLSIIRMIKSRRMRWVGHVVRIGRRGMHIRFWWESQKEKDH